MRQVTIAAFAVAVMGAIAPQAQAQQTTGDDGSAVQDSGTTASAADADAQNLLTQAELQNLVAPVALYPDTLLMQVLVASTYPLEIAKSARFLEDNPDMSEEDRKTAIDAKGWDASVAVLATAFPDVTADMADHLDWTETLGDAMLAQSDDVLAATQVMRQQAINSGALISGQEQTVEVDQEENVLIEPTNPETVYVPQYDPEVVYVEDDNSVGNAIAAGAIAFGTFALIDAIFDDDDPWNNYWGCRNCGGWGGRPIIRDPDIDLDIDGNVNIGNNIERPGRGKDGGWKPDEKRQREARESLSTKRGPDGKTGVATNRKPKSQGDDLRKKLSASSGAADISRPNSGKMPKVDRPSQRPGGDKNGAIARTGARPGAGGGGGHNVKKPAAGSAPVRQKPAASQHRSSAMKQRAPASRAKAGSHRGGGGGGHRSGGGGRKGRR